MFRVWLVSAHLQEGPSPTPLLIGPYRMFSLLSSNKSEKNAQDFALPLMTVLTDQYSVRGSLCSQRQTPDGGTTDINASKLIVSTDLACSGML